MKTLKSFVAGKVRNGWISHGAFRLYLRKGFRFVPSLEGLVSSFEIACAENDGQKGKGGFWSLVDEISKLSDAKILVVECVLNTRLQKSLEARCWARLGNSEPPSYYIVRT